MKSSSRLAIAICFGLAARISAAQPLHAPTDDFADLSLEELMQVQVPTITSASKFAQKATEAPASITVITKEEIQRFGYRTLAEILQSVRGLHVTSEGRYSYAGIRGFSPPGDYKAGLLLLIDGHRTNENIYGSALLGTEGLVDVDLIDHVEVVRGPASAIYGKGAFYGVINVVTRQPSDFREGEVSSSAGDNETYKTRLTLGHRFKSGFQYLLSGSFFESAGEENIFFKEFNSPATNRGIAHHLDYDHGRDAMLKLSYGDWSLEAAYKWRITGIPDGAYGVVFNDPQNRQRDQLGYVELKYTHDYNGWAVEARTSLNRYSFNGFYPYQGSDPNDPTRTVLNFDETVGSWWTGELQVSHKWQKHHFTLGADFQDNLQQEQRNYDISPPLVYSNSTVSSFEYGVFVQDEFSLSKTLTVTGATRYDWYTDYGGDLSFRFGVIYQPVKKTTLKFLYGDAYRSPTVYESFYQLTGIDPDPLMPERIHSYEAILEQELRPNLRLTATAFYNRIDDLIERRLGPNGETFYGNGSSVNTEGAELELEGRGPRGIRTRVSYSYQQSHYAGTGAELFNSPRQLAKLNVIVPLFDDKVSLGFEIQGVSSALTLGGKKADPYVIGNVTLFSRKLFRNLELSGSIYNVLDQRYGDPGGPSFLQDIHIQEGRSFRVKATYSF